MIARADPFERRGDRHATPDRTDRGAMTAPTRDGFRPLHSKSPFIIGLGVALFEHPVDRATRIVGVEAGPAQCNSDGFVHGGFLLAFADFALSYGTFAADDRPPAITLSLSVDFLRAARSGDWLEMTVVARKLSSSVLFADSLIRVGEQAIARTSGVFRPVRTPG